MVPRAHGVVRELELCRHVRRCLARTKRQGWVWNHGSSGMFRMHLLGGCYMLPFGFVKLLGKSAALLAKAVWGCDLIW